MRITPGCASPPDAHHPRMRITYGALSYLISLSHNLFKNIPHVGSFWHCGLCCICVFVFVYLCMRHLVISVLISLDQELSENIWFVWSKTSYCGENVGCHACGRTTDNGRNVKIEQEFWKQ